MTARAFALSVAAGILLVATVAPTQAQSQNNKVSYSKQIVPIMKKSCYSCHNPQTKSGKLDLMTVEGFKKGGEKGRTFVAKNSKDSRIVKHLNAERGFMQMPPAKKLTVAEINLIKKWIDEGAEFDAK